MKGLVERMEKDKSVGGAEVRGGPEGVVSTGNEDRWGREPERGSAQGSTRGGRPTGGFAGTRGSYAEATSRGEPERGSHGDYHFGGGLGLTDQQIKEGEDQLKRDEERRAKQIMLHAETVNGQKGLAGLTSQQLIEKAFLAMNEITGEGIMAGRPEKIEFVNAVVQRKGGVLFELGTKEERDWLVRPDVCEKFTEGFGCPVRYRARKYPALVEFVPVEANINRKETLEAIESSNGLEKGSIVSAKWIRDPSRRDADQRHAHLIVNCKSKEDANDWIRHSRVIEGKTVSSTKLLPEPLRCYKCQRDGHLAKQCTVRDRV